MSHPLDGCRAKIRRAKEQVNNLNGEVGRLLKDPLNGYGINQYFQPERKRYAYKVVGPPVPLRISILAGEIIHHLRSCFDHVIWALAAKNGAPDESRITFPVCETIEKYKKAIDGGIIKGVSAIHRPLIEALQPYRTPDPPNSILKIVHDLDITDKHRLLIIVASTLLKGNVITISKSNHTDPKFGIELFVDRGPWAVEDGEEVHWINLRGEPGTELEINLNSTVQIALAKVGTREREPMIPVLMQLCDGVENAINTFDACF
jgi:hypothetical protein